MLERYIICERYADNGELSHRVFVDSDTGEEVGSDGGEPEDATFWRDWKWVPVLLNKQHATIADLQGQVEAAQQTIEAQEKSLQRVDKVLYCKACHGHGVWKDRLTENEWGPPYPCPVCTAPLQQRVAELEAIIKQHDLCHDLHGKVGRVEFEEGCKRETIKEYGSCGWAEQLTALQADHARVLGSIETIRDAVLNGRGPLAEMDVDNDVINAILAIIDDNSLPAQPAQGGV